MNSETLKVFVLDQEKIKSIWPELDFSQFKCIDLEKAVIKIADNGFFIVDTDCCFRISETVIEYPGNKLNERSTITFLKKESDAHEIDLPIFETMLENLFTIEMSLKDFMGSCYNYNPRIMDNMRNLFKYIKLYTADEKDS